MYYDEISRSARIMQELSNLYKWPFKNKYHPATFEHGTVSLKLYPSNFNHFHSFGIRMGPKLNLKGTNQALSSILVKGEIDSST